MTLRIKEGPFDTNRLLPSRTKELECSFNNVSLPSTKEGGYNYDPTVVGLAIVPPGAVAELPDIQVNERDPLHRLDDCFNVLLHGNNSTRLPVYGETFASIATDEKERASIVRLDPKTPRSWERDKRNEHRAWAGWKIGVLVVPSIRSWAEDSP